MPQLFDPADDTYADERRQLGYLLDGPAWAQARRTILNAHYTDPGYVQAIWQTLDDLGFPGGPVLEPGSGAGTFIGHAPADADMIGVELDDTTARISRALYPSAVIRSESFARTSLPAGSLTAVVGNVPFGQVKLRDPLHNPRRHSLHNHFILKSLDLVQPGGMVAVLTSRYTMDSKDTSVREDIHQRADLVAAVRLPTGAHGQLAGTDAVTDLLILRRRPAGQHVGPTPEWIHTVPMAVPVITGSTVGDSQRITDGQIPSGRITPDQISDELATIRVNAWWDTHPADVLGGLAATSGRYERHTVTVTRTGDVATQLRRRLEVAATQAAAEGRVFAVDREPDVEAGVLDAAAAPPPIAQAGNAAGFDGFLAYDQAAGVFTEQRHGVAVEITVPKSHTVPLRQLLALRDTQLQLLQAEGASADDTVDLDDLRATLNAQYDRYVARYGPINHVTVTTQNRVDKHGNPVVQRRVPGVIRTFRSDPFAGAVLGLEKYDEETDTAQKAAIFTQRVVHPRTRPTSADSPAEAIAISVDLHGRIELDEVARLLDEPDPQAARARLGDLAYDDPTLEGRVIPAAEYLSGNVRIKLDAAEAAAEHDPGRYSGNVAALRDALPDDVPISAIRAQLGSVWIPATDVRDFLAETLADPDVAVSHAGGSHWSVRGRRTYSVQATNDYGTERRDAYTLAEKLLRQERIVVEDTLTDIDGRKRSVLNVDETARADEKAERLQDAFTQWVWADPDRSQRLQAEFNRRFNSLVLRDYTEAGQQLTLPGLAANFIPHPHQRTAVARILHEPSVGLFHAVGAGKTAEMVIGAMELRRLGLVTKPCVVVPNHMLEQITREWTQLYPQARLLAAGSDDVSKDNRTLFVGRAAAGDWDAVVMTQSAFGRVPMSTAAEVDYINRRVEERRQAIQTARENGADDRSLKDLERQLALYEAKLEVKLRQRRTDTGLTFEQTGIDFLVVDELHMYKNLGIQSRIRDIASEGSIRAQDLDLKIDWLRANADADRPRVVVGATATPIANSVAEAYTMLSYLRPDLLVDAGITDFDSWAATFGRLQSGMEITAQGTYKVKTRFARFDNLPQLMDMWHTAADIKTSSDLALPVPELAPRASDGEACAGADQRRCQPRTPGVHPGPAQTRRSPHRQRLEGHQG